MYLNINFTSKRRLHTITTKYNVETTLNNHIHKLKQLYVIHIIIAYQVRI